MNMNVSEEELIAAKAYIKNEITKHPGCMELETISRILNSFEKKCPKEHNTHQICYEFCAYRENGVCTIND